MDKTAVETVAEAARQVQESIERVVVGKGSVVELMLVAVLADGHVLIEDVPGIGKTLLARSLARSSGYTFRRIQCTPDLLPADVTGTYILNQKTPFQASTDRCDSLGNCARGGSGT